MRKKALAYKRISRKDQSNFSLSGQDKFLYDWAERNNTDIIASFTDDGISAKNFDRANWKALEQFIKTHNESVDYLVVVKYDRFSRNAALGLTKIEQLEKKYKIVIISVFEQIPVPYDSPFFFKARAEMLVSAEFELKVLKDRTSFGMHQALTEGRWPNKAPYGYKNNRDENNKPVLVIEPIQAAIVRFIFKLFLQDVSLTRIRQLAYIKGFKNRGSSAITRLLSNPLYGGLIHIPKFRNMPEKIIKGKHEGIVSEEEWYTVQTKLGKGNQKVILNPELFLRGVVKCSCGNLLTGAKSKGRRKHYYYYKCNYHKGANGSALKMHLLMEDLLDNLSFSKPQLSYLKISAEKQKKEQLKDRAKTLEAKKIELKMIQQKIDGLERKYIEENALDADTFFKWQTKFKKDYYDINNQIELLQSDYSSAWTLFYQNIDKLSNVSYLFNCATLEQKQLFLKVVFDNTLEYSNNHYRTAYLHPLFRHNALKLKEKGLLETKQPLQKNGSFFDCSPSGSLIEQFSPLFSLIAQIKVA